MFSWELCEIYIATILYNTSGQLPIEIKYWFIKVIGQSALDALKLDLKEKQMLRWKKMQKLSVR